MPFGFDRDRERDVRDDRGSDYARREFMREDDYRRRFEQDRQRREVQRMFRDRDDEMRHGHPSLRDDYNRERDWVSRGDDDRRYYDRGRDDDRRYYERSRDDERRYMSRDDDRGYVSRGPSYDDGYRSREDERYGRDDRHYMSRDDRGYLSRDDRGYLSRDDRGYVPPRHEQRDYGDRGGYGGYGNYGHRGSGRDMSREMSRDDEQRRWASDRDERERERYGQREYLRGRDDDHRRRY
jgi:23S rRNA pseudouridine2605 synthase